jgi:rubrerythrin
LVLAIIKERCIIVRIRRYVNAEVMMIPIEALRLALSQEIGAIDLYSKLAAENTAVRETMDFLIGEEQKHKRLLEGEIAKLTRE